LYASTPQTKKFLALTLGNETYAIDLSCIQEIKSAKPKIPITKISGAPPHILGIMTLTDKVITVVDLRIYYHLQTQDYADFDVLVIINIKGKYFAIIVDAVLDIVELMSENIKSAPDFTTIIHRDYIEGIGTSNELVLVIVNMEKLIYNEELQIAKHIPDTSQS
jgi:purine-binding chemotaxis protein CheW